LFVENLLYRSPWRASRPPKTRKINLLQEQLVDLEQQLPQGEGSLWLLWAKPLQVISCAFLYLLMNRR
jgi:hypothetical protein